MTIKPFIKAITAMAVGGMMLSASANSVGLGQMEYQSAVGEQVSITLNYDFTDFAMFGGGANLIYDASAIEFVSYTQEIDFANSDAQAPASPVGNLESPGLYEGVGIGTFEFFSGMTSAGTIGTFVFNVLGFPSAPNTPCGMTLCLAENGINPFVSLAGQNVTNDLLDPANGSISGSNVAPIPVPAAVWFMLSGLGALLGFGRKSA